MLNTILQLESFLRILCHIVFIIAIFGYIGSYKMLYFLTREFVILLDKIIKTKNTEELLKWWSANIVNYNLASKGYNMVKTMYLDAIGISIIGEIILLIIK